VTPLAAMFSEVCATFDKNPRWPGGPFWPESTVAIVAGGPSVNDEQIQTVKRWREASQNARVIVINTTFKRAPWADLLYACDTPWWDTYIAQVRDTFHGALWTQNIASKQFDGVRTVGSLNAPGLSRRPGVIHQGGNSGYQAINLAWLAGARRMRLLGFDMRNVDGRTHHHGDHPGVLHRPMVYDRWLPQFDALAADLRCEGVEVLNCTPGSALKVFPRIDPSVAFKN
jgi:hypothetical protein